MKCSTKEAAHRKELHKDSPEAHLGPCNYPGQNFLQKKLTTKSCEFFMLKNFIIDVSHGKYASHQGLFGKSSNTPEIFK